jgi:hypothetical protein
MAPSRYENTLTQNPQSVEAEFPFQIINLDFVSQDMSLESGRAEREIESIEATFRLQSENAQKPHCGFSIAYTTLLDSLPINCYDLIQRLNSHHRDGWSGILTKDFPPDALPSAVKTETIQRLLTVMAVKYGYHVLGFEGLLVGDAYSIVVAAK